MLADGVRRSRFAGDARKLEEEAYEAIPYDLIDLSPACQGMGDPAYCGDATAVPNAQERAQIGFTNMARQDPEGFVDTYNIVYACETATLKPLYWESLMNQAARFHSWELAMTSSFQHETTDEYAHLFDGDAGTFTRLDAFADLSPDVSQASSENIYAGRYDAFTATTSWLYSEGHCRNIFSTHVDLIGVGFVELESAPYRYYWTQNMAVARKAPTAALVNAWHMASADSTDDDSSSSVRFYVNYYAATPPEALAVLVDGVSYDLSLYVGNATSGTYASEFLPASQDCQSYVVQATGQDGRLTRLPETSVLSFSTAGVGDCDASFSERPAGGGGDSEEAGAAVAVVVAAVVCSLVVLAVAVLALIYVRRRRASAAKAVELPPQPEARASPIHGRV